MSLEMRDLEYIKTEFISPVIEKLDELEKTIKNYYEKNIDLSQKMFELASKFDTYREIHDNEHSTLWGKVRDLDKKVCEEPEKNKKSTALWLDITWKVILIAGVIIAVVKILVTKGII